MFLTFQTLITQIYFLREEKNLCYPVSSAS